MKEELSKVIEQWKQSSKEDKKNVANSKEITATVYKYLVENAFSRKAIALFEQSGFLEQVLWPEISQQQPTFEQIICTILMINEKIRNNIDPWAIIKSIDESCFSKFFSGVLSLTIKSDEKTDECKKMSFFERANYIVFLDHCFTNLENEMLRKECLKLCSIPLWFNVNPERIKEEIKTRNIPRVGNIWRAAIRKNEQQKAKKIDVENAPERIFLPRLIEEFFSYFENACATQFGVHFSDYELAYYSRMVEFVTDLLSQLPTRRFFKLFYESVHFAEKIAVNIAKQKAKNEGSQIQDKKNADSKEVHPQEQKTDKNEDIDIEHDQDEKQPEGKTAEGAMDVEESDDKASKPEEIHFNEKVENFKELFALMRFYGDFEVNEFNGAPLSPADIGELHNKRIASFQSIVFAHFRDIASDLAMVTISSIETRDILKKYLEKFDDQQLFDLAVRTSLFSETEPKNRALVLEVILSFFERKPSQIERINNEPIYPNEETLFSDSLQEREDPYEYPLPLPKLNLQYLTLHDYMMRNYILYKMESSYEIKNDVEMVVKRLLPTVVDETVVCRGFAKMALPAKSVSVLRVHTPRVGCTVPSRVRGEVRVDLTECYNDAWRAEWDALKPHDVIFLIGFDNALGSVSAVRGCEITEICDEKGDVFTEYELWSGEQQRAGTQRTFRVNFDPAQYAEDEKRGRGDVYTTLTFVMRREPEANNFKSVLDTLKMMMNDEVHAVPQWISDTILGYGAEDAEDADGGSAAVDFNDTFVSREHLEHSFVGKRLVFEGAPEDNKPPYTLRVTKDEVVATPTKRVLDPLAPPPPQNAVAFTPKQVAAIEHGMQEGLTLIVGPPGTGKTDVAVQIVSNLYHAKPRERILLLAHSNTALNHLFDKLIERDVAEQHCLRLGHGERELETVKDFSRQGRVDFILSLRLSRLNDVEQLLRSLGEWTEGVANTCETAPHTFAIKVYPRWNVFDAKAKSLAAELEHDGLDAARKAEIDGYVKGSFPFTAYIVQALSAQHPGAPVAELFVGNFREDYKKAQVLFGSIRRIFKDLEECAPLELFRTPRERALYLQTTLARVVAMTVTHVALKHEELRGASENVYSDDGIDFRFDTIVMEEAGEVLEAEVAIPMALQKLTAVMKDGGVGLASRLRRVVLIGDDRQLPPVVQLTPLKAYSHLDQSMFARLIKLGTPYVTLDKQGRCRPQLAKLFSWNYPNFGTLDCIEKTPSDAYRTANGGFAYCFQCIDVPNGKEAEPTPYFYQNLEEAEYIVQLYMFMRLLGYPAQKISILTTYNGQKALIRDIIARRCLSGNNRKLYGAPAHVSTVDKFQGQQNDYILLSLVRTQSVGHLRDPRRLVVAFSRARLGLYVVCKKQLFSGCHELRQTFTQFASMPAALALVQNELYGTKRAVAASVPAPYLVRDVTHLSQLNASAEVAVRAQIKKQEAAEAARQKELALQMQLQVEKKIHEAETLRMEEERLEKEREQKKEEEKRKKEEEEAVEDNLDESAFAEKGDIEMK